MSIVWSAQILASFGFEIYKKLENSENHGWHGNGKENQQIFTFVFITQYKLKMGKVSEKSIFSISKPYLKVSDFLRE